MSGDELTRLLRELVELNRVQVYPVAKELLKDTFFDGDAPRMDQVRIYANLDGVSSQTKVAEKAGSTQSTVSRWSKEWKRKGLVNEDGKAVFGIYDFFPSLKE